MQSLYERKLATYPRTDSQYITHDDLETLVRLTQRDDRVTGFITPDTRPDQPRLGLTVNDKKVAGHTAILPTLRVNQTCLADLNEQERLVLTRIVRRMWEAVSDDQIVEITTVQARISPECGTTATGITDEDLETGFTTRQEQALQDGWKAIEPSCQQAEDTSDDEPDNVRRLERIPPNLVEDVSLTPVCPAELHKGETKPPARFTDATLLNAMEHASRWLDMKTKNADELKAALEDDSTHASGIGTPATQAEIIERLASSGYITRQGKSIVSTPEGRGLIDVVSPKLKDVALTANLERQLSQVEHEQTDPARVDNEFRHYAAGIPAEAKDNKTDLASVPHKQDWGPCPRCGQPVRKTGTVWQCSSNVNEKDMQGHWKLTGGCGWKLFGTIAGKHLTDSTVRILLDGGSVHLRGFTSKTGRKFDAMLVLDKEKGARFDFDDDQDRKNHHGRVRTA